MSVAFGFRVGAVGRLHVFFWNSSTGGDGFASAPPAVSFMPWPTRILSRYVLPETADEVVEISSSDHETAHHVPSDSEIDALISSARFEASVGDSHRSLVQKDETVEEDRIPSFSEPLGSDVQTSAAALGASSLPSGPCIQGQQLSALVAHSFFSSATPSNQKL